MCYADDERILIVEGSSEVEFYFSPKELMPDFGEITKVVQKLISSGACTDVGRTHLPSGEMRVYLNPMRHDECHRETVMETIARTIIMSSNSGTMLAV